MERNLFDVMDRWWKLRHYPDITEGTVETAANGVASIRIGGGIDTQPALYNQRVGLVPGDTCIAVRTSRSRQWRIIAAFGKSSLMGTIFATPSNAPFVQLAPPNNFHSKALPGLVAFEWDAPPQQPVAFEIQTATDNTGTGATTRVITRGSYYLLESSDALYGRARSINEGFQKSSWTDWVACTPSPSADNAEFVISAVFTDDDLVVIGDSPSGYGMPLGLVPSGYSIARVLMRVTTAFPTGVVLESSDSFMKYTAPISSSSLLATGDFEFQPNVDITADTTIELWDHSDPGLSLTYTGRAEIYVTCRKTAQ